LRQAAQDLGELQQAALEPIQPEADVVLVVVALR
jgi:hypothetical protein